MPLIAQSNWVPVNSQRRYVLRTARPPPAQRAGPPLDCTQRKARVMPLIAQSNWVPVILKGATSFGLRAPRPHSARGPLWIAPKGKLA